MKLKFAILILILTMMLGMSACGSSDASEMKQETVSESTDVIEQEQTKPANEDAAGNSSGGGDIGHEKVKEIVLAKVPGAVEDSIYDFERDIDDGRIEYEGSIYHDGYEYEFEVDGATGNILKWEIDD